MDPTAAPPPTKDAINSGTTAVPTTSHDCPFPATQTLTAASTASILVTGSAISSTYAASMDLSLANCGALMRLKPLGSSASKIPTKTALSRYLAFCSASPQPITCNCMPSAPPRLLLPQASFEMTAPSDRANRTHTRHLGSNVEAMGAALMAPNSLVPLVKSTNCWAISTATRVWASSVDAPKCGVAMTFLCLASSAPTPTGGSVSKTSKAAPLTVPALMASSSADSSMMPPRATLRIATPFLHLESASALIM